MSEWKETDLGKLSSNFIEYKIKDIAIKMADAPFGSSIKNEDYETAGVVVVQGNNINGRKCDWGNLRFVNKEKYESLPRSHCFLGDLVFPKVGTIGKVGILTKYNSSIEYLLSTNTMMLRVNPERANQNFVYYFFSSQRVRDFIEQINPNSVQPVFNFTSLKNFSIYLPPLSEQTTIAEVLCSLDDKIDLLQRQNKTLEALAETLFRQWFVEEAEESWEFGTIEDEFNFIMGQSPLGTSLNESGNGVIFYQGRTDFGFRFPEPRVFTTSLTRMANKFDTLVSVRAPVGDMNMAIEECCLGRGVAAFRYKHNNAFYSYTYYKMRSLMGEIKQFEDSGTVFGSIGKDDFKTIENVIAPREFVENFQNTVKPMDDKIFSNTIQIKSLTNLRDTLLPKLMSGEVRVKMN